MVLVLIRFFYLLQISGVKQDRVVSTFTLSILGTLGLAIFKELLSVWQDDPEHLPSVSGERQIRSLHSV